MCTRLILAFPWGKVPPQGADEGNATDNRALSVITGTVLVISA